jgi:hypothetical protein
VIALALATVWEVRGTGTSGPGNDSNGGGYVAGSGTTDYSQQNSAQLTLTDVTTVGASSVISSVTGGFTAQMVGNILQINSGTNFTAGFYQIASFTSSNSVTLDRACVASGNGSAGHLSVGGALATLGKLAGAMVSSNWAYCTGAFTTNATITFAQSINPPVAASPQTALIGYGSSRGDSTHATLTLQSNSGLTAINASGFGFEIAQFDVDCASLATSTGIKVLQNYCTVRSCKVSNAKTQGISAGSQTNLITGCEVTGCAAGATAIIANNGTVENCFVHDNSCLGIYLNSAGGRASFNLSCNNSGASSVGIQCVDGCEIRNNTIHNNGSHGISHLGSGTEPNNWQNNILTSNGGYGINGSNGSAIPASPLMDGNAFWNNTSGARNLMDSTAGIFGVAPYTNVHDVTLSGSPYVGGTTGTTANFALNSTAGAGAACRAAGSPGTWPGNTGTTGYLDMGAVQHPDPAGGGALLLNPSLEGM